MTRPRSLSAIAECRMLLISPGWRSTTRRLSPDQHKLLEKTRSVVRGLIHELTVKPQAKESELKKKVREALRFTEHDGPVAHIDDVIAVLAQFNRMLLRIEKGRVDEDSYVQTATLCAELAHAVDLRDEERLLRS